MTVLPGRFALPTVIDFVSISRLTEIIVVGLYLQGKLHTSLQGYTSSIVIQADPSTAFIRHVSLIELIIRLVSPINSKLYKYNFDNKYAPAEGAYLHKILNGPTTPVFPELLTRA